MRCKVCLKKSPSLRQCSGCKVVQYCSPECQRVDWTKGGHKSECRRLREDNLKVKTAFGRVDASEIAWRIFRAVDETRQRGGGDDSDRSLISKVVLPSAALAERMMKDARYDRLEEKGRIDRKDGEWFVDVLSYFLDEDDDPGCGKKNLNRNVADAFFLAVVADCHSRSMKFAVDRSARDYLTVVRANLSAIKGIMADADEPTMDRLELLFYALHWLEVQALVVAGRAKLVLEDYSAAEALLDEAEATLNRMASTSFSGSADQKQLETVRSQIGSLRRQLPIYVMEKLSAQWAALKDEEGRALESFIILRKLGLVKLRSGDVEKGRKDLIKSLNRMVKYHNSVKEHLSPDQDLSEFFTCLGEAYELCALYAMPGEPGKGASDVVKMQQKALELFLSARRVDKILEGKLRLWNWHRNGRVRLRWSDLARLGTHPQFSARLSGVSNLTIEEIRSLNEKLLFAWDERCSLCSGDLSWNDPEDDDVEVLIACKHSFHTACVNLYLEDNEKECPKCRVAFCD